MHILVLVKEGDMKKDKNKKTKCCSSKQTRETDCGSSTSTKR